MRKIVKTIFLLTGGIVFVSCQNQPTRETTQKYPVFTVSSSPVEITNDFPAAIRGQQDIEIYSQVPGKIVEVVVTEGQRVKKGQTLFIIDQAPYKAALRTASANVSAAKAATATARLTYDGKRELFNNKVISQYELSTAENVLLTAQAQQAQAEAEEDNARNNLSYTVIESPSDGVVGTLPYRAGTLVGSSSPSPLTTVSDNSEMYVYFSMPENQLLSFIRQYGTRENMLRQIPAVFLRLNDGSIYSEPGRIESISGVIDSQTGAVSLRASFPNHAGLLHSGGAGNVIMTQQLDSALTIPQSATYEIQDKVFAYRVVNGIAKSTRISVTPLNDGKEYLVRSGLQEGEKIVSEGVGFLQDDTPIAIK